MVRGVALLALAVSLSACKTLMPDVRPESGVWGGPEIGVTLEGGQGTVEFDCASGTIDGPVFPGKGGIFSVKGTHRTGQSGPIKVGQIFRSQTATYAGTLLKDDMTLSVALEDGSNLGPFTLRRGAPAQLTPCL